MKAAVIVNSGSGTLISRRLDRDYIAWLFQAIGIEADIHWLSGPQIEAVRSAVVRGVDVVVAGGGDGTIRVVAGPSSSSVTATTR